jgi:hypothetical protein
MKSTESTESTEQTKNNRKKNHVPKSPRLFVEVTEGIIAAAEKANSGHCMIADAVEVAAQRKGIGATNISVDVQTIRFSDPVKRLRYIYLTPRVAQYPLVRFDLGVHTEPFSFRIAGGHVVNMPGKRHGKYHPDKPNKTEEQLKRTTLITASPDKGSQKFRRAGGAEPPTFSMRREFGLRAFSKEKI